MDPAVRRQPELRRQRAIPDAMETSGSITLSGQEMTIAQPRRCIDYLAWRTQ
jgi:hypothetical protein